MSPTTPQDYSDVTNQTSNIKHQYLTANLPGVGGVIKQRPEDFLVEEQPLYEPCGEGEHMYLFVEKTAMTTLDAVRVIAKAFRVSRRDVGYAGLKDKHAITRQHFSIYRTDATDDARAVEQVSQHPRLVVHWAQRHTNKLKRGHHGGNRFSIRIREVEPTKVMLAKRVLDRLAAAGIPNFLGEQRFGYRHNGHILGRMLLLGQWQAFLDEALGHGIDADTEPLRLGREAYRQGDYPGALEHWPKNLRFDRQALDALRQERSPEETIASIDPAQRKMLVSATQSAVFNRVVARRIAEGTFDRLLPGDLAWLHRNGSVFAVDEPTAEADNAEGGRVASLALSASGPMWGMDMTRADGAVDAMEVEALAAEGLTIAQLAGLDSRACPGGASGSRRPMRVPLIDPEIDAGIDEHGGYIRVAFELPRGAFATVALGEIMKTPPTDNTN